MNKKKLLCALLLSCSGLFAQNAYDLVIVGGNPGGIMAPTDARRTKRQDNRTDHAPV